MIVELDHNPLFITREDRAQSVFLVLDLRALVEGHAEINSLYIVPCIIGSLFPRRLGANMNRFETCRAGPAFNRVSGAPGTSPVRTGYTALGPMNIRLLIPGLLSCLAAGAAVPNQYIVEMEGEPV